MEAQVWTLIGLLGGTLLGSLVYLGGRIDALGGRIDALSGRIDGLSDGLRRQAEQISELGGKLDDHLRRHAG